MGRTSSCNSSSTPEIQNARKLFSICLQVDQEGILSYQLKFLLDDNLQGFVQISDYLSFKN
jgi:hypothetical protein